MAVSNRLLSMKWVTPGMPNKGVPGTLGGEPGRGDFGLFRRSLTLLGHACPSLGAPLIKKSLMKTYCCVFSFPETDETLHYGSFSCVQWPEPGWHETFDALGVFQNVLKAFDRFSEGLGGDWG